jgi:hypothetical protein
MCHEVEPMARSHAAALADDGSDTAVMTGHKLIIALAAACGWGA